MRGISFMFLGLAIAGFLVHNDPIFIIGGVCSQIWQAKIS